MYFPYKYPPTRGWVYGPIRYTPAFVFPLRTFHDWELRVHRVPGQPQGAHVFREEPPPPLSPGISSDFEFILASFVFAGRRTPSPGGGRRREQPTPPKSIPPPPRQSPGGGARGRDPTSSQEVEKGGEMGTPLVCGIVAPLHAPAPLMTEFQKRYRTRANFGGSHQKPGRAVLRHRPSGASAALKFRGRGEGPQKPLFATLSPIFHPEDGGRRIKDSGTE